METKGGFILRFVRHQPNKLVLRNEEFQKLLLEYKRAYVPFFVGYEVEDKVSSKKLDRFGTYETAETYLDAFSRFVKDESGVTAIEYGLIAALISVVCIAAMTFAGQQLLAVYNQIGNSLAGAIGG